MIDKKYCANPECHKELRDWRKTYCSPECYPPEPEKPPKRKSPPNPRPLESPNGVGSIGQPENGEPDKPKSKGGPANKKRSDELLAAIFHDMAQYNMTQAQACAGHSVRPETFSRWINEPECGALKDRAECIAIKRICAQLENAPPGEWKKYAWRLERFFRAQFSDPAKIGVQVNTQINNGDNGNLVSNQAEAEEARQRLDECKILEAKRKTGVATNTELLEYVNDEIEQLQYLRDRLLTGETPDQETQKQLYQLHEERRDREQQPIKEAVGHTTGDYAPLAIQDRSLPKPASRPEQPQPAPPATSMRAGETDPSSGQPIPQRERPTISPPSERQAEMRRQRLEWDRARRGGEGKSPDLRD